VCTVLFRYRPGSPWPLLLAAVRDEFVDRAWEPPAAHWPWRAPGLVGGYDRAAKGTWLAVDPQARAAAALLNGARLDPPADRPRPTRGGLPLAALTSGVGLEAELDTDSVRDYDGFHLLLGTLDGVALWTWDGTEVKRVDVAPGDHIIVNAGLDTMDDPLVPHFLPLLAAAATPPLDAVDPATAWGDWIALLRGDGLAPDDPRALLVRVVHEGRTYGSTSATLVALGSGEVRYDFTPTPDHPQWTKVLPAR
jgi:transport and Golgi organization protein 2